MKLIDKDAVVAEIERRLLEDYNTDDVEMDEVAQGVLASFKYFLDTLEVKEVNLEKEIETHLKECLDVKFPTTDIELIKKDVEYTARMFFELGLKAQKGENYESTN